MYKIMIVDDEPVIRKGLLCFVNWEILDCEVICEASNGLEAIEKLTANNLDIVITDIKMPGLDGLELSKHIYEKYPTIKVIVLTAYADFSYAQAAIRYNVVDFIIKTNPSEKIPEAVRKAKKLIEEQEEKREELRTLENTISGNLSEIREKFINEVLNRIIINPIIIENKAKDYCIKLENYFVIVYEINSSTENDIKISSEEQNKFIFSVKNFLSLAFKDFLHYTVISTENQLISIVSFASRIPAFCTQSLLLTCNEILAMVDNFMKFTISIGISSMHQPLQELSTAYAEAKSAKAKNFYNDNNVSVYQPKAESYTENYQTETNKFTDEIIGNIHLGNDNLAISGLYRLFDEYKKNNEPIEQVKVASIVLCSQCYRLLANYKLDISEVISAEPVVYQQIQDSKSIQSLLHILSNIIKTVSNLITSNEKQYSFLVKEANKYIRNNYFKDISLQSIANHVHLNSSYLSRLYKKETGEAIIDALNRFRIEKAKLLLTDPSNKIFEVASRVGIEDSAYFTHVFIKYTGVSPKEYKTSLSNT